MKENEREVRKQGRKGGEKKERRKGRKEKRVQKFIAGKLSPKFSLYVPPSVPHLFSSVSLVDQRREGSFWNGREEQT